MDSTGFDKYYPAITFKYANAFYKNWKAFWKDNFDLSIPPYLYHTKSSHTGTARDYLSKYKIPMMTVETPQDIERGNTNSYRNDMRSCKLTKDLVINLLQGFIDLADKAKALNKEV
jgi:hypothetical protein